MSRPRAWRERRQMKAAPEVVETRPMVEGHPAIYAEAWCSRCRGRGYTHPGPDWCAYCGGGYQWNEIYDADTLQHMDDWDD